jgi:small subunit ribosomal protein S4
MRRKVSEYGLQLREKQKVRRLYGILERQFHRYYKTAAQSKGITGENIIILLERRLDNTVYRLGFAPSRKAARQLVRHRHFTVNDKIVDIPSYSVSPGDIVRVREKSKRLEVIHMALKGAGRAVDMPWLRVDKAHLEGEMTALPSRLEIPTPAQEQLIVELYSR